MTLSNTYRSRTLLRSFLRGGHNGGIRFVRPRGNRRLSVIGVYVEGTGRRLTRGRNELNERFTTLRRLTSLLNLGGPPRCVRDCSVSRAFKTSGITKVIIFRGNEPVGSTCGHFTVGKFSKRGSINSVGRILAHHFGRCCGSRRNDAFGVLPSLVLLSNNRPRIRTILPVVRGVKLGIPIFNVIGSGGRHAHTVTFNNNRVRVGSRHSTFALISGVRRRIRHFTVSCRRGGRTGDAFSSNLLRVRNVNRGGTGTLLHRFGAVKGVGRYSRTRLHRYPSVDRGGTHSVCRFCRGVWGWCLLA